MAGQSDAFDFVLESCRRTLRHVKDDPRVASPRPGRGAALAAHVSRTLAVIEGRVDGAVKQFPLVELPEAQEAHVRNLRLFTQLARALHMALPWLDGSERSRLDLGTLCFVDEMALGIVGHGVETLVVPDSEYMYSTLSWPFRLVVREQLNTDVAQGTRPIVLFFPLKEANSALFDALFAHELGHAAADEHNLVSQVVTPLNGNTDYTAGLEAASHHIQAAYGWSHSRSEAFAKRRLRQWVEELLCDAVAVQYLGPSYLFAFGSFVLASSWNDPQQQHPPPTLRVAALVDQLTAAGWVPVIQAARPELWKWFEWVSAAPNPVFTPDNKFLRDMVIKQAATIVEVAATRLGTSRYLPALFDPVALDLAELLRLRILPAEHHGTAVDRRNIMLSAWLFALQMNPDGTERTDNPAALPAALGEVAFQRFIAKAFEMSTVAETWRALP